ncbi:MAG: hypothetical protein KOO63_05290, partial [Bacteroidales bacterium]|nr:hypothetical protein [Candidatus Latescibacterota bacterium]
ESVAECCRNRWPSWPEYPTRMEEREAAKYERPFQHVLEHIKPERERNQREVYRQYYWRHVRPRPAMRAAFSGLGKYLVTTRVAKHRLFAWIAAPTMPDSSLIAFARVDDYFLGILHSRFHEIWSRGQATQLREASSGTRYTPTSCFDTFPFPWPLGQEPDDSSEVLAVAEAARELDAMRTRWLNPPEWVGQKVHTFAAAEGGPWDVSIRNGDTGGEGGEYCIVEPIDAPVEMKLKKRTLTALYNEMPRWLSDAHKKLDVCVAKAYGDATGESGIHAGASDEEFLVFLLELNQQRSG